MIPAILQGIINIINMDVASESQLSLLWGREKCDHQTHKFTFFMPSEKKTANMTNYPVSSFSSRFSFFFVKIGFVFGIQNQTTFSKKHQLVRDGQKNTKNNCSDEPRHTSLFWRTTGPSRWNTARFRARRYLLAITLEALKEVAVGKGVLEVPGQPSGSSRGPVKQCAGGLSNIRVLDRKDTDR